MSRWLLTVSLLALGLAACGSSRGASAVVAPIPTIRPSPAPFVNQQATLMLGASYAPLLAILQTAAPGPPPGFLETISPYVYVTNLADWEARYPAGSVNRDAVLAHELLHAQRQGSDVVVWCARYNSDAAFRLSEEEMAYAVQIKTLAHGGVSVDADSFVAALTDPFYGGMIDAADARVWVNATVAAVRS